MAEAYELDLATFRSLLDEHFSALKQLGFEDVFTWRFADTCYASWERPDLRILLECGTRLDYMWTLIYRLDLGRQVALDTLAYLRKDERYPPHTGWTWTFEALVGRLKLEAEFLRLHLPAFLAPEPEGLEYAGTIDWKRQSEAIDDPGETFSRECRRRFEFLEVEVGLEPEISNSGAGVLFRGDPFSVEIGLVWGGPGGEDDNAQPAEWDDEEEEVGGSELFPEVVYNAIPTPGGRLPRSYGHDVTEHGVPRDGPDTDAYFEQAFGRIEDVLRRYLRLRGVANG